VESNKEKKRGKGKSNKGRKVIKRKRGVKEKAIKAGK